MRRIAVWLLLGTLLSLFSVTEAAAYPFDSGSLSGSTTNGESLSAVAPGSTLHIAGSGYLPGGKVDIILHSTPVTLMSVTANGSGSIDAQVSLPTDITAGPHQLEALGPEPSGGTLSLVLAFNAVRPGAAIPRTGTSVEMPVAVGVAAAGLGAALLALSRRRARRA